MPDLTSLLRLSAKLGRNLDLVQAGGGNTSLKDNGTLWVKASGKWLVRALDEEMFLPVPRADILRSIDDNHEYVREYTTRSGATLRPSVETAMHAVIPHRVVVHVHSVNTIAWAVRTDMPGAVRDCLTGLRWAWVPYVHPGLVLAKEIRDRLASKPDVLILGNHGLIVAAGDCEDAEDLLEDVERRLACPVRQAQPPDVEGLREMVPAAFQIAPDPEVHALATDPFSLHAAALGALYPDQCVYLGPAVGIIAGAGSAGEAIQHFVRLHGLLPKVLLVAGRGVLVADDLNRAGREVLTSVSRVMERLDPAAAIHALEAADVSKLINWEAEKYRIALASQYDDRRG